MADGTLNGMGREATRPEPRRRGPDFIGFGAQKGGTRWMFDQLDAHPDFWMPPIKELHYFNSPASRKDMALKLHDATRDLAALNRRREKDRYRILDKDDLGFLADFLALADRPVNYARYAALFDRKGDRLSGDITPGYSALDDDRAAGIVDHFPEARYLFIARDPVKRFWSQVCMHVYKDRLGTRMKDEAIVALVSDRSYAKRSFQSEIVARWKRLIPADQFALFFLDELVADPKALRARVISFVGGDPDKPSADLPPDFNRKEGKSSLPLSEQLGHMLAERLSDELKACADMFGGPAEDWPKRYGL